MSDSVARIYLVCSCGETIPINVYVDRTQELVDVGDEVFRHFNQGFGLWDELSRRWDDLTGPTEKETLTDKLIRVCEDLLKEVKRNGL